MANDLATLRGYLDTALDDIAHAAWGQTEKENLITWAVADLYPRFVRVLDPTTTIVDLVDDTYFYSVPSGVVEVNRVERFEAGAVLTTSLAADDIIDTTTAHDFSADQQVRFTSLTGGTGLSTNTAYYVIAGNLAATTFQVSTTLGGSAVNFTSDITAGVVELVGGSEHGPLSQGSWSTEGDTWGTLKLRIAPVVVNQGGTLRIHGYGRYDATTNLIPDHLVPLVISMARQEAYRRIAGERARFEQWQGRNHTQDVSVNELLQLSAEAVSDVELQRRRLNRTQRRPVPGRR